MKRREGLSRPPKFDWRRLLGDVYRACCHSMPKLRHLFQLGIAKQAEKILPNKSNVRSRGCAKSFGPGFSQYRTGPAPILDHSLAPD